MQAEPYLSRDAHQAASWISVPATFAFRRLADPQFIGGWSLGSMGLVPTGKPDIFEGRSTFDGSSTCVRIAPYDDLGLIDYYVGTDDDLYPRINIRVSDGPRIGAAIGTCLVVLTALRALNANPENWTRTCTCHEVEILLIRSQLETAYDRERE